MLQALPAGHARADEADEDEPDEPDDGPRVVLRIDRPTARLQQRTMLGWRNICIPPCGAVVDPEGLYRIAGGGAVESTPFSLPRESGDVFVEGKVGSKAKRFVGIGLAVGGVLAAGVAGFMWSLDSSQPGSLRDVGLLGIGVSVLLAAIGVVVMSGGRTSVRVR
jgi:hypothetical protein